ncbi:hypothetical protein PAXINDRAFT_30105, partial [Paxillus involutus ATCC 200175]
TVYESEVVGLSLAIHLLETERDLELPATIYIDNQAAIKASNLFSSKSGHYLVDRFRDAAAKLRKSLRCKKKDISICWISGHDGVEGNEKADEEAKKAAEGTRHSSPARRLPTFLRRGALPLSASALKQEQKTASNERWKR